MSQDIRDCSNPFGMYPHGYMIHFPLRENEMQQLCKVCFLRLESFKKSHNYQFPLTINSKKERKNVTFIGKDTL